LGTTKEANSESCFFLCLFLFFHLIFTRCSDKAK